MIKYALGCKNDHEFEGWFSSSDEFDRLLASGHLECAVCGSQEIQKLLMAPSVNTARGKAMVPKDIEQTAVSEGAKAGLAGNGAGQLPMAASGALPQIPDEVREKVVDQLRELKKYVVENAENVGDGFTREARKMHYGETEKRGIYGRATPEDAAELMEEGVEFMPLPVLPEDQN